jgi:hypothetical protein
VIDRGQIEGVAMAIADEDRKPFAQLVNREIWLDEYSEAERAQYRLRAYAAITTYMQPVMYATTGRNYQRDG